MKRYIILAITICVFMYVFSFNCFAQISDEYEDSFNSIGAQELDNLIDENTERLFKDNDIDIKDYSWVNKLSPQGVFGWILNAFTDGAKTPVKSGISIVLIIIISAAFTSFDTKSGIMYSASAVAVLALSLAISYDIWSCIYSSCMAVKYISIFMVGFIPIFIAGVYLSGGVVTATASGSMLLVAAQAVSYFAQSFVMPLMGGYLSLSLVSCISPFDMLCELSETVKKFAIWTMTFVFTVFTGLVGITSAVNASADTVALKSTKFVLGTCVPIAGTALSEAAGAVYSSMGLLKSSVGIYGVVVIAAVIIPLVIRIFIWKGVLSLCSAVSKSFGINSVCKLLNAVNSLFSVLNAILLFCGGLFIISLGLLIPAVKL